MRACSLDTLEFSALPLDHMNSIYFISHFLLFYLHLNLPSSFFRKYFFYDFIKKKKKKKRLCI